MRLYVLSLGANEVDKGVMLTPGSDLGKFVSTPVPGYLVETNAGERVLIDTGLHPGHIEDPDMTWSGVPEMKAVLRPRMTLTHTVEHQLALIGLRPEDVTHVVSSHLHFDHCGQHFRFAEQPIFLSQEHRRAVCRDPAFPSRYWDVPGLHYVPTGGEGELFGGITALSTPGHAPYHCSFVVDLPETGKVVLAIDAILSAHQLATDAWFGHADPDAARASARRLQDIARRANGLLLFGHDPDQWSRIRHAPDFYG